MITAGLISAVAVATLAAEAVSSEGSEAPEDIIVTGTFNREVRDSSSPLSVLDGAELQIAVRQQIGDTLSAQAGVSSTSFGPNASRPVLRGLQGERIRILTDGIGAFDVSNTSADHAVVIDPLISDRIEVLRGPASLRYGSSAIGGVVNVIDKRIPLRVPDKALDVTALATWGSAARDLNMGGGVTLRLSPTLAAHAAVSRAASDDLRTGGALLGETLRAAARASTSADVRALAALSGRIPNSDARTVAATAGIALINDGGNLGVAVSRYDANYGLPIRFSLEPGAEQEAVRIIADQTRVDARAGLEWESGWLDSAAFRAGFADYVHVEQEEDGSTGTVFSSKGFEARAELRQRQRGGWQALYGVQSFFRDFAAVGAEAFVPPNETFQLGAFTMQELELGALRLEAGLRYERTSITSQAVGFDRNFSLWSLALGGFLKLTPNVRLGLSLSSTARAPAAEELLADGPHVGTQSYEIGNPAFGRERARSAELMLRTDGDGWQFDLAAYYNRFSGYIYEFQTGAVIDDLPVFQFAQAPARYWGLEAEGEVTLWRGDTGRLTLDALGDLVRARIEDFGAAPRIPPWRIRLGGQLETGNWTLRLEAERNAAQRRVTAFETATPGFTLVNASIGWDIPGKIPLTLAISANNIGDVVARRHASFLKDFAPLAGRDIRLSLRLAL